MAAGLLHRRRRAGADEGVLESSMDPG
jgi:hypothetical protein